MKKFLLSGLLAICGSAALAQGNLTITAAERQQIIDTVALRLQQYYVFPEKAKAMAQYLKKRSAARAYNQITDYRAFIDTLHLELQRAHMDPHMRLVYNPEQVSRIRAWLSSPQPSAEMQRAAEQNGKRENYGFVEVERLPGNIGYLDFRQFYSVTEGSENTVAAAMNFLANTDAVIIDLRRNGGGDPRMVQLIVSYFLDKPVHYNSIYDRTLDTTEHFHALEKVKGQKMPNTDLYILTSKETFSGAEEFAYNMQNLKRATLIGETTGGGAHPTRPFIVNEGTLIAIPFARAINPFTKTNWEGTGVKPDVEIEAGKALQNAQQIALEKALAKVGNTREKVQLEWMLAALNASVKRYQLQEKTKPDYPGSYGDRTVTLENGELLYQRGDGPKRRLIPMAAELFQVEDVDYFRVQFVRDANGTVEKIIGLYDNGNRDESPRTKARPF